MTPEQREELKKAAQNAVDTQIGGWPFHGQVFKRLTTPGAILSLIAQVEALTVPQPRYTCDGKGGTYERIGTAKGAGTSRDIEDVVIYRDSDDGALYYRTEIDFAARMIAIPAIPGTKEGA